MNYVKGKTLEEITAKLDAKQKKIAENLRSLVRETLAEALETVKWGNITYLYDGQDLAWIIFYEDHVDFGFFRGAELQSELLEGTGKNLRHIKIPNGGEVPTGEIGRLLIEATKLEKK